MTPRPARTSPARCWPRSSSSRRTRRGRIPADRLPAPAHPLLRRQHADARAALSRSVDGLAHQASRRSSASQIAQTFGARLRRVRGAGAAQHRDVRARVRDVRAVRAQGGQPPEGRASRTSRRRRRWRDRPISSARWTRCRSGSTS